MVKEEIEKKEVEDFTAEKLILEDLGVDEDKINKITNKATAEKVVKYYQNKATKEAEKKPPMLRLKANMGNPASPLPPPGDIAIKDYKLALNEKMDPLCVKHAYNNRYQNHSRISVIFTKDHPNGRYF